MAMEFHMHPDYPWSIKTTARSPAHESPAKHASSEPGDISNVSTMNQVRSMELLVRLAGGYVSFVVNRSVAEKLLASPFDQPDIRAFGSGVCIDLAGFIIENRTLSWYVQSEADAVLGFATLFRIVQDNTSVTLPDIRRARDLLCALQVAQLLGMWEERVDVRAAEQILGCTLCEFWQRVLEAGPIHARLSIHELFCLLRRLDRDGVYREAIVTFAQVCYLTYEGKPQARLKVARRAADGSRIAFFLFEHDEGFEKPHPTGAMHKEWAAARLDCIATISHCMHRVLDVCRLFATGPTHNAAIGVPGCDRCLLAGLTQVWIALWEVGLWPVPSLDGNVVEASVWHVRNRLQGLHARPNVCSTCGAPISGRLRRLVEEVALVVAQTTFDARRDCDCYPDEVYV